MSSPAPKPDNTHTLSVDGSRAQDPLRDCVREALNQYLRRLGEEEPRGVYDFVIGEVEAPLLEVILEYTRGNQTRAAEVLGINRGTLRKKLRQYNLS